jgi:DNA repair exonuclease SbcCD nuclease subunit
MVNLLWRTDLHLADESPASRTDVWADTLFDKLTQIGNLARSERADAVIDGGDFFHLKSPGRNSHELVRRAAEVHKAYPCPTYVNVGNHDVKYGALEFLSESPLSVLYGAGVFQRLYDEHEAIFTKGKVTVRVVGIPYHGTKYDLNRLTSLTKGSETYLVVAAHLLACPSGGTMYEGEDILKYADLANLAPDVFAFGHWHRNQGIREIAPRKYVVNLGSLSRGSLTQDEMSRVPSVATMSFTEKGITIKEHPLRVRPPEEVFDLAGKARIESREASVDALVENIQKTVTPQMTGSVIDEVRNRTDIPEVVRERVLSYLELAEASR